MRSAVTGVLCTRTSIKFYVGVFITACILSSYTSKPTNTHHTAIKGRTSGSEKNYTNSKHHPCDTLSASDKITNFPSRFFDKLNKKSADLSNQVTKKTKQYLKKIEKSEAKLKNKLSKIDSTAAKNLFSAGPNEQYRFLENNLKSDTSSTKKTISSGDYYANTDSLQTSLTFLSLNPQLLNNTKILPSDIQNSLNKLHLLQAKMQDADQLKQYIQQRKAQIQQYLSRYTHLPSGITNIYQNYNKEVYYYQAQLKAYKETLNDPDKMMSYALLLLNKMPAFSNFMKSNSMIAGIFNVGGTYNPNLKNQGLPTRDMVLASFGGQSGLSAQKLASVVQKNVGSAQGEVDELRNKLAGFGLGGGSTLEMPNFDPSSQKTKSFIKRLEVGTNLQTVRTNYYFPTTSDLGLSLGYKIDDKHTVGIGASYKIGWGTGLNHIRVTSQGLGIRSYIDTKIKLNIYLSGGFEYNYQQPIYNLSQLKYLNEWTQSGLLGISKIISLKSQMVKKTKIQLFWDFLSYQQIPRTQPLIFRVGYSF